MVDGTRADAILDRALRQQSPGRPEDVARRALNQLGWEQTPEAVASATERASQCTKCRNPLEEWEVVVCEACAK